MSKDPLTNKLSRRERQIMDALFEQGEMSAQDVRAAIPEPPSYSAVRALIAKLVEKNLVSYREEGPRYIYFPVVERSEASANAMQRLIKTFFAGSAVAAVNALLGMNKENLTEDEVAELQAAIEKAKKE